MNKTILFFLVGSSLLAACGQNKPKLSPPPPPPTNTFSLASTPSKTAFTVPKGGEAKLTITVSINSSNTAKVKLSGYVGTTGIQIIPETITVTGNGSAEFTIKDAGISDTKPYFYIYGQGLNAKDNNSGQELRRMDFQWTVQ